MKKYLEKLSNNFKQPSFRFKLVMSHMSISLAVILIFGGISIPYTYYVERKNEEESLNRLVAVVNDDISSRLETYNNSSFNLVINDIIQQNLDKTSAEQRSAKQMINSILMPVRIGDSNLSNIMILDFSGSVYSTDISLMLPPDFSLKDTSVYKQAATGKGKLVWLTENDIFDSYSPSDIMYQSRTNIHAAAVIKDYTTNRELGILIISLRKNFFTNINFSNEDQQNTRFYLISPDKTVIYPVSSISISLPTEIMKDLDFSNGKGFSIRNGYAIDCQYNKGIKWYMISITDDRVLFNITNKLIFVMLASVGVCIILSVIISRTFSRVLYSGIAEMRKGILEVEKGNFDIVIYTQRTDEFGQLIESFNRMVRQIRDLITEKFQQELARQKAEFHALQMQINPHFLYNTFDMLHWKLIDCGQEKLSESVVAISKVLRYSISNSTNNVTLKQELEDVCDYLTVLHSISDREIEYEVHVVDERKIPLPRLVIQPLVENCIIHGFESRSNGNKLTIHGFYLEPDIYSIDIIDNGLGIRPQKVMELNDDSNERDERVSVHLGIRNVRLRVQYLYGSKAKVLVTSQYGIGTCIRIILPLQKDA
jgi:two-component system sensor histidine kinase YesM